MKSLIHLALITGAVLSANAADFTWTGGAVTQTNWDLPANWLPSTTGLYPLANDIAIFGGTNAASSTVINLQSAANPLVTAQTVGQLVFQGSSAPAYTIGTNSNQTLKIHLEEHDVFEISRSIWRTADVESSQIFEADIEFEMSDSFWGHTIYNDSPNGSLTFNGNLVHTGGNDEILFGTDTGAMTVVNGMILQTTVPINLNYAGNGTLVLNGVNNFSKKLEIGWGTLVLGPNASVSTASRIELWGPSDENVFPILDTTALNFTLLANQPVLIAYNPIGDGVSGLWKAGTIDITNGSVIFDSLFGEPADDSAYVFMTYSQLVGSQFASVQNIPAGYTIDYHYNGNSIALVQVVPEPSVLALISLGAAVFGYRLRRVPSKKS